MREVGWSNFCIEEIFLVGNCDFFYLDVWVDLKKIIEIFLLIVFN